MWFAVCEIWHSIELIQNEVDSLRPHLLVLLLVISSCSSSLSVWACLLALSAVARFWKTEIYTAEPDQPTFSTTEPLASVNMNQ